MNLNPNRQKAACYAALNVARTIDKKLETPSARDLIKKVDAGAFK